MTKARAIYELVFAGLLWGFGFIATKWSLVCFSPALVLVLRYVFATGIGVLIHRFFQTPRPQSNPPKWTGILAGMFLAGFMITQTIGLQYTTATNSGFLTCLYVVFVPVFHLLWKRKNIGLKRAMNVLMAVIGAFLLSGGNIHTINVGDLWTVGCAVLSAFHILFIDHIAEDIGDPFQFNNLQSFWGLIFILPLAFAEKQSVLSVQTTDLAWAMAGVLFLALGSTLLAFLIQIRTQKILEPTTASMLFLLEGIFALVFGVIFYSEVLRPVQFIGVALILVGAALQVREART